MVTVEPRPVDDRPPSGRAPVRRVLVANRGEIAVRVIRTLRRLGIHSIAVYSDADADAPHVRLADEAVRIGPAPATESYLDPARIIEAARATGAEAIHPGYGFLSEHAGFAEACRDAGIVFVGPGREALDVMGDKIRAKRHVAASGVPTVPGIADPSLDDDAIAAAARSVGFPLLVKPSPAAAARACRSSATADELAAALAAARRVARAAFGDDTLFLERSSSARATSRCRSSPMRTAPSCTSASASARCSGATRRSSKRRRRRCSTPRPASASARAACDAARSVGYLGAGTVEFLVSDVAPDEFFFIEMNTRLQVEHPVTELVTGVDLVEQQLRVAAGEPLAFAQDAGARSTGTPSRRASTPRRRERGFLPSTGPVARVAGARGRGRARRRGRPRGPADHRRTTTRCSRRSSRTAPTAHRRSHGSTRALADTVVLGVDTNIAFLRRLLAEPAVQSGDLDTGLIDRMPDGVTAPNSRPRSSTAARPVRARRGR